MNLRSHMIFIFSALVLAVLQTTLVPLLLPVWLRPDLLLVLVVLLGLFLQPAPGSAYAFGLGYLQDLLTGTMTGLFVFDRLVIYLAAYWLSGQFYAKSAWTQAIIVGILSIADYILVWTLSAIFSGGEAATVALWMVIPRALSSALFGLVLFFPLSILWEGGQREL